MGRAYALLLGSRGCKVLVNDINIKGADAVVKLINDAAGQERAAASYESVLAGATIVKQAMDKWKRVDILISNAGIIRDKQGALPGRIPIQC